MRFLTDDMHQIIEHLRNGARLIGPVTVSRKTGHGDRPWGFSDGRRANKMSVDALAARGLIVISDNGHGREAILTKESGAHSAGDRSWNRRLPSTSVLAPPQPVTLLRIDDREAGPADGAGRYCTVVDAAFDLAIAASVEVAADGERDASLRSRNAEQT